MIRGLFGKPVTKFGEYRKPSFVRPEVEKATKITKLKDMGGRESQFDGRGRVHFEEGEELRASMWAIGKRCLILEFQAEIGRKWLLLQFSQFFETKGPDEG